MSDLDDLNHLSDQIVEIRCSIGSLAELIEGKNKALQWDLFELEKRIVAAHQQLRMRLNAIWICVLVLAVVIGAAWH